MNPRKYYEWNFDTGKVTEWAREGECNGCAQCCVAMIRYRKNIPDFSDGDLTKSGSLGDNMGRSGIWYEISEGDFRRFMQPIAIEPRNREHACHLLTDDNRCSVHALKAFLSESLMLCDTWPIHPDQVTAFDQCSYTFVKVGEWDIEHA